MAKISGPLLDRIDIQIEVPAVPYKELSSNTAGQSSQQIRAAVVTARDHQATRFQGSKIRANAKMTSRQLRNICQLSPDGRKVLQVSVNELGLSARAHDKVLRVARTIADLEHSEPVEACHVQEAVNYRMLDRKIWT